MKKDYYKTGLFILLIIIMLAYLAQKSYAKYIEKLKETTNIQVASWNIELNDEHIAGKKELLTKITPIFPVTQYTKENILAPGSIGYYDIKINANDVDTTFTYEIDTKAADESIIKDLKAIRYEMNGTSTNIVDGKITGIKEHNTGDTKIRVYIQWYDEADNQMDNAEDTELVTKNSQVLLSVNMKFTQKKN